ncbi:hypothetical protein SRABI70_02820 [Pseudomonas sp. Bi70]|nr:hypothetical protein SRABI70_02820 [Pseudomonas sp. Bi70]
MVPSNHYYLALECVVSPMHRLHTLANITRQDHQIDIDIWGLKASPELKMEVGINQNSHSELLPF